MAGLTWGFSVPGSPYIMPASVGKHVQKGGFVLLLCCILLRNSARSRRSGGFPAVPPLRSAGEMFTMVMNYSGKTERCLFHVHWPLYQSLAPGRRTLP